MVYQYSPSMLSSVRLVLLNQFLYGVSFVDKMMCKVKNYMFDIFEGTIVSTTKHDILNPYEKTYNSIFLPWMYVTINYNRNTLGMTTDSYVFQQNRNWDFFYTTWIIHNRKMVTLLSNKPAKKVTNDFKKLPFCIFNIYKSNVTSVMNGILTDVFVTANHVCVLTQRDLSSLVTGYTNLMTMYCFRDAEILNAC